jgi:hypothetical protein
MDNAQSFLEPRKKLGRGAVHIDSLAALVEHHLKTDWYTCNFGQNSTGQYNLNIVIRGPSDDFGLIVGDAVHNLRATLDLLAVEIVRRNGGNTKGVYFPFADSAEAFDEMFRRRNFNRASVKDQAILRALQPYRGGNDLLRSLHDLDIQDKHHSLIPHAAFVTTPRIAVKRGETGDPIDFAESELELQVDPKEPPQVKFVFPEDSVFAGEEVIGTLWRLHQHIGDIIEQFAHYSPLPNSPAKIEVKSAETEGERNGRGNAAEAAR